MPHTTGMLDSMIFPSHSPQLLRELDDLNSFYMRTSSTSSIAWNDQPELNELASRLANQSLACSSRFAAREARIPLDSCDAYANTTDSDADWAIPVDSPFASSAKDEVMPSFSSFAGARARASTFPRPPSPLSSASCRRAQRQRNTRLLCGSASHRREMEELVATLLSAQDDAAPPTRTHSVSDVETDGSPLSSEPATPDSGVWNGPSGEWSFADEESDGSLRASRSSRNSVSSAVVRPVPCVPSAALPSTRAFGPGVRKNVVVKGKPRRSRTAS